ncbi:MAG: class A beta-lactamase-related serine hydrolase [Clostridiales bacterium]|nr:class A beta-lactamase-related serine hydrolase [Clostridiales bacterium]
MKSGTSKKSLPDIFKILIGVIIGTFVIFIACIVVANNNVLTDDSTNDAAATSQEDTTTTLPTPTESDTVKSTVASIIAENGLSEENFAFFYYNTDTYEYYFFNEDTYFTAASTIKVPITMLYYDMINSGEISADDTLLYASDCYEAGDGQTASTYSVLDYVPIDFLLEQSIVYSDNTAINILIKNLGYSNCRQSISEYAPDIDFPEDFYSSNITSAQYGYEIMSYLYENADDYETLISDMKESSYGEYLKKYLDVDVAHKYGSYNGYVHDYGIVYADTTYLIGVFTSGVTEAAELIAQISLDIYNLDVN